MKTKNTDNTILMAMAKRSPKGNEPREWFRSQIEQLEQHSTVLYNEVNLMYNYLHVESTTLPPHFKANGYELGFNEGNCGSYTTADNIVPNLYTISSYYELFNHQSSEYMHDLKQNFKLHATDLEIWLYVFKCVSFYMLNAPFGHYNMLAHDSNPVDALFMDEAYREDYEYERLQDSLDKFESQLVNLVEYAHAGNKEKCLEIFEDTGLDNSVDYNDEPTMFSELDDSLEEFCQYIYAKWANKTMRRAETIQDLYYKFNMAQARFFAYILQNMLWQFKGAVW